MKKEKKSIYKKWWFWVCIVIIGLILIGILEFFNSSIAINKMIEEPLDKEITEGRLTYYVSNSWRNKEDSKENDKYNYYYPTDDTMLMVGFSQLNDYSVDNSNIDEAINGYFLGMGIKDEDLINKDKKKVNEYDCGVIRYYTYSEKNVKHEVIAYVIFNANETYSFFFGQEYNLNEKCIQFIENIISKSNIVFETEDEKVQKMEKKLESIRQEVESEQADITTLKENKKELETYKNDIEKLNFEREENQVKKDVWKNTIAEIIGKIDTKINIAVPDFNTMTSSDAKNWGKTNSITVTTSTDYSDTIPNGKVISQSRNAGQTIEKGTDTINVIYSIGKKPTIGEMNALTKAQSYSDNMFMSKKRLYEQLTSSYGEGFTASEAQYAIDHVKADWNYNALQKAKSYQSNMNMSKSRIQQQLTSSYGEGFTASEAQYAISHLEE